MAKAAWLAGEAAILATALAELVGGAIALRLLFGLPAGRRGGDRRRHLRRTGADARQRRPPRTRHRRAAGHRGRIVRVLLFKANPAWTEVAQGVARTGGALRDPQGFLIALGILGATLMPHNLYLHSLAGRTRRSLPADARDIAMRVTRNDTALSLGVAMLINAAIMIVAAASLSGPGLIVSSLDDAHAAIGHTLGAGAAIIFAVALYAAGQSSTITGVLAGRILSRGFQAGRNWSDAPRAGHPADRGRGRGGPAGLLGRPGSRRAAGAEPGDPEPGPALRAGAAGAAGLPQVHHGPARAAPGPGRPSRPPSASSRWMAICWPIPCCNAASALNRHGNKRRQHRAGVFSLALAGGVPIGRNHRMVSASGIHVMQHLAQGAAEGRHAQLQSPPGLASEGPVRQGLRLDGLSIRVRSSSSDMRACFNVASLMILSRRTHD